jgi:hypothetical protein
MPAAASTPVNTRRSPSGEMLALRTKSSPIEWRTSSPKATVNRIAWPGGAARDQ